MSRVFDDCEAMLPGDLQQRIHLARMAAYRWNGKNCLYIFGSASMPLLILYCSRDAFRGIDIQSVGFNIHENGPRSRLFNGVDARTKRHRRRDDGIARTDSLADQSQVERRRAGASVGQRRRGFHGRGKIPLKALHLWPGGDPIRAKRVDDFGDFFFADRVMRKWEQLTAHVERDAVMPRRVHCRAIFYLITLTGA